jgi:hypothetical protein
MVFSPVVVARGLFQVPIISIQSSGGGTDVAGESGVFGIAELALLILREAFPWKKARASVSN